MRGRFFRSRWVEPPAGVEELRPRRLAPGFRAAGRRLRAEGVGGTDVGIVACDGAGHRLGAAVDPERRRRRSGPGLPRSRATGSIRAAVVNSGNANAATGERGYADAVAMQERCAAAIGVEPAAVAVAETGTIGVPLDTGKVLGGIDARRGGARAPTAARTSRRRS